MSADTAGGDRRPAEIRSYHGQPVLKQPVWTAEIPLYFFAGGLSGASAALAYLSGLRGQEVLAKRAWAAALGGIAASPPLLISDLGRPERFLNMLRMFKLTSPMSVGSWILSTSGAATTLAGVNAWTGWFPRASSAARPTAALAGLPLCTYTAALVANTAVPAWHEARRELPFVFASGAALSAGAGALITTPPRHARPARRLALAAAVCELGFNELMEQRLGQHGEVYKHGPAAKFRHLTRGCTVAGAALLLRRGASSRPAAAAAGMLLGAGALSARWSVYKAGFASAADPQYVVGPQRAAVARSERRGAARREAKVPAGEPRQGSPAHMD